MHTYTIQVHAVTSCARNSSHLGAGPRTPFARPFHPSGYFFLCYITQLLDYAAQLTREREGERERRREREGGRDREKERGVVRVRINCLCIEFHWASYLVQRQSHLVRTAPVQWDATNKTFLAVKDSPESPLSSSPTR